MKMPASFHCVTVGPASMARERDHFCRGGCRGIGVCHAALPERNALNGRRIAGGFFSQALEGGKSEGLRAKVRDSDSYFIRARFVA
ncbi:MAG: hypothetical protein ACLQAH_11865 [Limisphaerales bacterium]